jgi:hypothetical protein
MSPYYRVGPFVLFLPFWAYVVWCWVQWLRTDQKDIPKWRAAVAFVGLSCATLSTALSAFLFIHAVITGGYTYYHPVELFCIRAGTFTALLGIVGAVAGKGNVDGHVAVISILNLLLWFIDGVSQ